EYKVIRLLCKPPAAAFGNQPTTAHREIIWGGESLRLGQGIVRAWLPPLLPDNLRQTWRSNSSYPPRHPRGLSAGQTAWRIAPRSRSFPQASSIRPRSGNTTDSLPRPLRRQVPPVRGRTPPALPEYSSGRQIPRQIFRPDAALSTRHGARVQVHESSAAWHSRIPRRIPLETKDAWHLKFQILILDIPVAPQPPSPPNDPRP